MTTVEVEDSASETADIETPSGSDAPGQATGDGSGRPRRRWGRIATACAVVVLLPSLVAGFALATTYQPVQFGGGEAAQGAVTTVNGFGGAIGDYYLKPGHFSFVMVYSLFNTCSYSVTIERVTPELPSTVADWPVAPAGPVRSSSMQAIHPSRRIAGQSLAPLQGIYVYIPLRLARSCYEGGYTVWDTIAVEEHFLWFSRWATFHLVPPLMMNTPGVPHGAGPCAR